MILSGDIELNPGPPCNFKIAHLNCRSLKAASRRDDIEDLLVSNHKFDIIALTETHIDDTVTDSEVEIPNYKIFLKDRNRMGGGVAIYCNVNLEPHRRLDLEIGNIEMIWVEINVGGRKFLTSSCYRPPGQNARQITYFLDSLQQSLELAIDENPTSVVLLGDLNDRCTIWNSNHHQSELKDKLVTMSNLLNLHQLIHEPTRGNNLLDIILTSTPSYLKTLEFTHLYLI